MAKKYADIKVGYDCNNNCIHCVISDQRDRARELRGNENRTEEECYNEIAESFKNGCKSVTITGGEPTIRHDFVDIVKFAKQKGMEVTLQSNGRLFSSKQFLDKVKDYIDIYMIALHGSTAQIHDKITQSENSFNQVIKGLKNLKQINATVAVKVVMSNYNSKDFLNIIKLVQSLGISYVNIAFPHANGNALRYFDEIVPYYKNIREHIEECIEYVKGFPDFRLDFEAVLPCALKSSCKYDMKYFSDLKIHTNLGELKQLDEGTQVWGELRKASKRKGLICSKCVYNSFCEGYWKEYVEKRGFSEFKPITKMPKEVQKMFLQKLKSWRKNS